MEDEDDSELPSRPIEELRAELALIESILSRVKGAIAVKMALMFGDLRASQFSDDPDPSDPDREPRWPGPDPDQAAHRALELLPKVPDPRPGTMTSAIQPPHRPPPTPAERQEMWDVLHWVEGLDEDELEQMRQDLGPAYTAERIGELRELLERAELHDRLVERSEELAKVVRQMSESTARRANKLIARHRREN